MNNAHIPIVTRLSSKEGKRTMQATSLHFIECFGWFHRCLLFEQITADNLCGNDLRFPCWRTRSCSGGLGLWFNGVSSSGVKGLLAFKKVYVLSYFKSLCSFQSLKVTLYYYLFLAYTYSVCNVDRQLQKYKKNHWGKHDTVDFKHCTYVTFL